MKRDIEKDKVLKYLGWTVIHFWGKDILRSPEECVRVIEEVILNQSVEAMDWDEEI